MAVQFAVDRVKKQREQTNLTGAPSDPTGAKTGADTMSRRLTPVVLLATLITAGVWDATAFAQVVPGAWLGSATCKTHAESKTTNYHNDETHTWKIVIPQVITLSGSIPLYAVNWTVTGGGGNDQNSWITDGGRPGGLLEFR